MNMVPGSERGILVIHDDLTSARRIKVLLESKGYLVFPASSKDQALSILGKERIDLILLDATIEDMDSGQVLQELRKRGGCQDLPVIYLFPKSGRSGKVKEIRTGSEDYLLRPFSQQELLSRMDLWLRIRRAEARLREQELKPFEPIDFSVTLASSLDLNKTLRNILETCRRLRPSASVHIMLVNDRDELMTAAHIGLPQEWHEDLRTRPVGIGESLEGWVIQHQKILCLPDIASNAPCAYRSAGLARKYGVTAYLGIPLLMGQRAIGLLNFNGRGDDPKWAAEPLSLLEGLGRQAAVAIENAKAYAQAKEAEEYLKNLVDSSYDAISVFDLKGIIRWWNKGAELTYGYLAEEVQGRSIETVVPEASWEEEWRNIESVIKEGGGKVSRGSRRCKDGRIIPVVITWSLIRDHEGNPQMISAMDKDMSEVLWLENLIYESKKKLVAVIDSITDFLYAVDQDFRITQINRAYASHLNEVPRALVGRTCYESLHRRSDPCPDCMAPEVLEKAIPLRGERRERASDGQERIWGISAFPIMMGQGKASQVIYQHKDISKEKELELELVQTAKMASLGQLAAGIAHQINNPLASISIYRELLSKKEPLDEEAQRHLEVIEENVDRIAQIVRGLLDYSQPRPRAVVPLRLPEIIRSTLGLLDKHARFHGIEIHCEVPEDLPLISGDSSELGQVLLNLMLNATQSMPRGGHLRIEAKQESEQFLQVCVRDSGSGISAEDIDRIFDPFFATQFAGKAGGLGLTLAQRIIENHKGRIWADSELGVGSTFTFTLPIFRPAGSEIGLGA